jgi:excisionase family DNA binding protein
MIGEKQEERQATMLLSVKEVATYLAVTERTVYRLVKDHRLPAYKVGGQWRFKVDLIDAWMSRERALECAEVSLTH